MTRPPFLGFGIGLRREHYREILEGNPRCDFFEAISENYMEVGGRAREVLHAVRERFPLVLHGVSLSIGSTDALDAGYLRALKALAEDVAPEWVSDHLCWTGVGGHNAHDLLPLPYTEEALAHVVERVKRVQDALGRRIALENVSSYMTYRASEMPEWEFVARVAEGADCGLLFDVNNIFVSGHNHGFDPRTYLEAIPPERVWQIHLAGPSERGGLLLDTHDSPVRDEVWELYRLAVLRFGPVSTILERDDHIPPLAEVLAERDHAARIAAHPDPGSPGPGLGVTGFGVRSVIRDPRITDHRPDPNLGNLGGIQGAVWELIVAPEGVARALEEEPGRREALAGLLAGDERATAEERLDVYANMYFFRIKAALEEDFPRTAGVLGEARWHNLVTDYLLAHPSSHWSLRWVGRHLPAFVRERSGGEGFPPWLADLSELEWARGAAFQAEDAPAATRADLAAVPPEGWGELRFAAVPGVRLLELGWDVPAAWDALEGLRENGGPVPEVQLGPRSVLVYRTAGDDAHEALEEPQVRAVRKLFDGRDFADVCETFLPDGDDADGRGAAASADAAETAGARAVGLLVSLVDRGILRLASPAAGI